MFITRKSMSPLGVPYAERKNAGTIFQQFGKISALETKEEVSDEPSFTPNPPHASNITSAYRYVLLEHLCRPILP